MKKILGPVAIIGTGKTGNSVLQLLRFLGVTCATFSDYPEGADFYSFDHMLETLKPRTLVVSPGYPLATPWIQTFQGEVTSDMNLATLFLEDEIVIGITGSVGKSTVTSLLSKGLAALDPNCFAGGNLGVPICDYILEVLKGRRHRAKVMALELSSYQLENSNLLTPAFGALTHLSPNHLDRYNSLQHYYETKWQLTRQVRKMFAVNASGGDAVAFANDKIQKSVNTGPIFHFVDRKTNSGHQSDRILGEHNADNFQMAIQLAEWAASDLISKYGDNELNFDDAAKRMYSFGGLPHRLEFLGEKHGAFFVNDSKATSLESVRLALKSIQAKSPKRVLLLLGGRDKDLPWQKEIANFNLDKVKPFLFGESRTKILSALKSANLDMHFAGSVEIADTLSAALKLVARCLEPGDWVLLSPGGTSLDEFGSFEERGKMFTVFFHSL